MNPSKSAEALLDAVIAELRALDLNDLADTVLHAQALDRFTN